MHTLGASFWKVSCVKQRCDHTVNITPRFVWALPCYLDKYLLLSYLGRTERRLWEVRDLIQLPHASDMKTEVQKGKGLFLGFTLSGHDRGSFAAPGDHPDYLLTWP